MELTITGLVDVLVAMKLVQLVNGIGFLIASAVHLDIINNQSQIIVILPVQVQTLIGIK